MKSSCISFREIPQTTRLFETFLSDFSKLSHFYSHPPTEEGIAASARAISYAPETRQRVVDILRDQNRRFAADNSLAPAAARNLDRFAAGAVAIVTGQQVGLFSG